MKNLPDFEATDKEFSYSGSLGADYSSESTVFRVWSPVADRVEVRLYESTMSELPFSQLEMSKNGGVWTAEAKGDLHGVFYTYLVTVENETRETIDIYAKAAGTNGIRGMVVDLSRTNPAGWENSSPVQLESYTDVVIYELHVRDFSSDESGNFKHRGKFIAFAEKDVKNEYGDKIGLDYIGELGVTHIHLLPVFDFQTVDETDPNAGFNWGYDPLNFNIPEGSYSTDPKDGVCRIKEFKELILAAHQKGIGIIMDVVYNHTFDMENSPFNKTFPDYYYRHNKDGSLSNGSGCGNEFASERIMAGKFITDSLCYLAREYKLDGFRFDLMGLLDIETLNRCSEELRKINPSIILYGEGWTGGTCPLDESLRGVKKNAVKLPRYAMFSDDFRDGVKGSVFNDKDCGFVNGNSSHYIKELIKSTISAGIYRDDVDRSADKCWTDKPQQSVNYAEAHDNLTLYDKLKFSMCGKPEELVIAADKMAAALIFLSQGIPFMQAGQEFLRSKGFVHDSYNSPDSVNSLKWNNVTLHKDIVDYYKGLIAIRKRFPCFRMRTSEEIKSRISYEESGEGLAIHVDDFVLVLNPSESVIYCEIKGRAEVYANGENASEKPLYIAEKAVDVLPLSIMLLKLL